MLTETADYATLACDFRWDIPDRFNIAAACCDRHADGSGRLALIFVDEDGRARAPRSTICGRCRAASPMS